VTRTHSIVVAETVKVYEGQKDRQSSELDGVRLARHIKEYLRAHFDRRVRLQELTDLTGLSKAYLIRSFHRLVGMPPCEWLLQIRIDIARQRLKHGCDIRALAAELGFANQSHFHRRFKRVAGLTPAAYVQGHYRSRRACPVAR
jgi:AraC-like DNA-binding protein